MSFDVIAASEAPRAIGPYSQATRAGGFIFCSGQAGLDPMTNQLVEGGIREQTVQALRNIQAVLRAAGADLSSVVKVTVFLHDWSHFAEMNEVFAELFPSRPPARSTIRGERWPPGSLVAIEAIAVASR
jgi:2-iminobutanoate/2-iminopropanoate deaminase